MSLGLTHRWKNLETQPWTCSSTALLKWYVGIIALKNKAYITPRLGVRSLTLFIQSAVTECTGLKTKEVWQISQWEKGVAAAAEFEPSYKVHTRRR